MSLILEGQGKAESAGHDESGPEGGAEVGSRCPFEVPAALEIPRILGRVTQA
jgi:hypothetical protein